MSSAPAAEGPLPPRADDRPEGAGSGGLAARDTTALLSHGISWPASDGTPRWALRTADGADAGVALAAGTACSFAVLPGRWCLGRSVVAVDGTRRHEDCPARAQAERGTQCGPCFARDGMRAMHDFHRSGHASPGLRAYLGQPHWLYVASFAHGASKVGTASAGNKWRRLAEQGAVAAGYVALAPDGRAVRVLEDLVTSGLGLGQAVRASAKAAGLVSGGSLSGGHGGPGASGEYDDASLAALNAALCADVRSFLAGPGGAAAEAHTPQHGAWERPAAARPLVAAWNRGALRAYPEPLRAGEHGFTVVAALGQVLAVSLEGSGELYAADASVLKGRLVVPGVHTTAVPGLQDRLF